MSTLSAVRFVAKGLWLLAVGCWLSSWFLTSSIRAAEVYPGPAPENWREGARAILSDHSTVTPSYGPWHIVGPFRPGEFSAPYPPETDAADPAQAEAYRGQTGTELRWREAEIPDGADFDLRRLCPDYQGNGTLYLARTITVERNCVKAVDARGMSGLAVRLNGKQLVDRGPGDGWLGGGWAPKEALLPPLAKGANRLLVKVEGLHKNGAWVFRWGEPEPAALRYTLSMSLERTYPEAALALGWLRRDGLDVLNLWPHEKRGDEFNQRMKRATGDALQRGQAWLGFLRAAGVPEANLAEPAGALDHVRGSYESAQEPSEGYFAANAACRRIENLPRAQVIENWLQLDELSVLSPMDEKVRASIAAALKRGERLLDDYGAQLETGDGADSPIARRARLGSLSQRLASLSERPDSAALRQLYVDAHTAVRDLAFANPLLNFGELVFYERYSQRTMNIHRHQFPSARYMDGPARPGGDLCVLSELRPDAKPRPLLRGRLGKGIVRGYDLAYDARRVVFGYWNAEVERPAPKVRFEYDCYVTEGHANIYELDLEEDRIRQLTDEPWHDIDPCYLPGGRIAFASERCGHNAQCDPNPWSEPMVNLYTVGADSRDVRRLTSHKDSDNFARVLEDGRVSYTRWEYHERGGLLRTQTLWVSRPDGTQQDPLFKQHLDQPFSLEEARAIPESNQVVAVATGHHTNAAGAIVRISLKRGVSAAEAMEIVTPGFSEFEGGLEGTPVPEGGVGGYGYYSTPWPLSDKYFLVSYNPGHYPIGGAAAPKAIGWGHYLADVTALDMTRAEGYGLYVIDVYGNRELVYRDPEISCFSPIPLVARPVPPVLPDATDPREDHATLLVTDVHQGLGVPAGTVKYIRISEAMPWPYTKEGASRYPREHDYTMKRTIGIVPVAADGSAHFTAPANVGLYFQALDEDFIEVRRMRSLVSFQPGERRACTGCHETQGNSPTTADVLASRRPAVSPEPPPWGSARPISFLRDVQPVLDRHCVSCHSGVEPDGGVDLFPGLTGAAHDRAHSVSFDALTGYVPRSHVPFAERKEPGKFEVSQPYEFGSAKSRLVSLLKEGHEEVKLNRDEWLTLLTWIDAGGLYLGSFVSVHDWGRWGYRPQPADMQAVRAVQEKRCASCHADADLARPGWIDPRKPEASLYLLAPLAKEKHDGWEKCQPAVFRDTDDPDYQTLLAETRKIIRRMRADPTPGMKELLAAEAVTPDKPAVALTD
ncbi:MAG: hypothetical protein ABIK89_15795 [Planctomycetota bacterium]